MKKLTLIHVLLCIFIAGCASNELSREEAFRLIQQRNQYPQVVGYDIYTGDPKHAKKVLDAGLERAGLLTVHRTQKLSEAGSPLIRFTEKAHSYFLATPGSDKASNIQNVKLADEELVAVVGIKMAQSEKSAEVEYTTAYKNLTPFSVLVPTDFKKNRTHKANFFLYDNGWRLAK